jgi:Putative transposase
VGGRLGCLAVLHTWTRDLRYHPHVHLLVTAGGLSADGTAWIAPKYGNYLVPVHALSQIFRAKICAALNRAGLLDEVPSVIWATPWVVHCQHAGRGQKVLDYLGRYIFRVAIANSALERIQDGQVTFRYRDNRTQRFRRVTLSGVEFLQRFLQHVLPRGCVKVRSYGIWSPSCRRQLDQARALLTVPFPALTEPTPLTPPAAADPPPMRCPQCRTGILIRVGLLTPQRMRAP